MPGWAKESICPWNMRAFFLLHMIRAGCSCAQTMTKKFYSNYRCKFILLHHQKFQSAKACKKLTDIGKDMSGGQSSNYCHVNNTIFPFSGVIYLPFTSCCALALKALCSEHAFLFHASLSKYSTPST